MIETTQILGNLGEFVGAIGVVLTLGYLAVQVRQNTRALEMTERQAVAQTEIDYLDREMKLSLAMIADQSLLVLIERAETDFSSLNSIEQRRVAMLVDQHLTQGNLVFRLSNQGLIGDQFVTGVKQSLKVSFSANDFNRLMWPFFRESGFDKEFVGFIDAILVEQKPST